MAPKEKTDKAPAKGKGKHLSLPAALRPLARRPSLQSSPMSGGQKGGSFPFVSMGRRWLTSIATGSKANGKKPQAKASEAAKATLRGVRPSPPPRHLCARGPN